MRTLTTKEIYSIPSNRHDPHLHLHWAEKIYLLVDETVFSLRFCSLCVGDVRLMGFSHCERAITWSVTSIIGKKNTEPTQKLERLCSWKSLTFIQDVTLTELVDPVCTRTSGNGYRKLLRSLLLCPFIMYLWRLSFMYAPFRYRSVS